ncbi:MAG: hypothetical protein IKG94_07465 [Candidatus Methanomethylophilaceae archaeon]|nr:hypothetical protein [Candidatus Methanomethylophilaceae archaeon]MBR6205219.1 hypothetical protein [Candidatus Methanomethylophilaceae archaeon]
MTDADAGKAREGAEKAPLIFDENKGHGELENQSAERPKMRRMANARMEMSGPNEI